VQASYWIAKADTKGDANPPAAVCLASAVSDVETAIASLSAIDHSDELYEMASRCKALAHLKWVHIKIQTTAVNNVPFSESEIAEALAKLEAARQCDPRCDQVDVMEAEVLNTAGKFDQAIDICERAAAKQRESGRGSDSSALVIMSSSMIQMSMALMQQAHYSGDQEALRQAQGGLMDIAKVCTYCRYPSQSSRL
jgi:predicted Zn-dependent protease